MKTPKKLRRDESKELRRENSKCRKKLRKIRYMLKENLSLYKRCLQFTLVFNFEQTQTVKKLLDREATRSRKEEEKVYSRRIF